MNRNAIRIASLMRRPLPRHETFLMSGVRWLRMSESLAGLGYQVDLVTDETDNLDIRSPLIRCTPYSEVNWRDYDVIKTEFHLGFETLLNSNGADHPFIVAKLGSVVGSSDGDDGVHFFGDARQHLYEVQSEISRRCRYTTVLTEPSRALWEQLYGANGNVLLVPTGVDCVVPPPGDNPYREFAEKVAVYIGSIYTDKQREVNLFWQERLNRIGKLLRRHGIRLCFIGVGHTDLLDGDAVTYLGPIPNDKIWDYQYHADVGVVLAQGPVQHNESSKIYYYLRAGLPVVSERPVPNSELVRQASLGFVCDFDDDEQLVDRIADAANRSWDRQFATQFVLKDHTWDRRASVYDKIFRREFGIG